MILGLLVQTSGVSGLGLLFLFFWFHVALLLYIRNAVAKPKLRKTGVREFLL